MSWENAGFGTIGMRRNPVGIVLVLLLSLWTSACSQAAEENKAITRTPAGARSASSEPAAGDLYAVVVGISSYANPKIPKLKVSDKDAKDFAGFLGTQAKLFKNIHLILLLNEKATKRELETQLVYELRKAGKDDTVIVFLSGHGANDPRTPGEFFFLTHDSDPEILAVTAVHMNRQWFVEKLESKRFVLIADACHGSGVIDRKLKATPPSFQTMAQQFKESEGRVFITSSRADQYSKEMPERGNSLFTHFLLEGLSGKADENGDGIVTLKELYDYVYAKTKDASRGEQHPQWEARGMTGTFPVALYTPLPNTPVAVRPMPEPPRPTTTEGPAPVAAVPPAPPAIRTEPQRVTPAKPTAEYPDDVKKLLLLAQQGDAAVQYKLGLKYAKGDGVPIDQAEAVQWYRKAAEQSHAGAQHQLGQMYEKGEGVAKDNSEALRWYRKAAKNGYFDAQYKLVDTYAGGKGAAQDLGEAFKWYLKASNQKSDIRSFDRWLPSGSAGPKESLLKKVRQGDAEDYYTLGMYYHYYDCTSGWSADHRYRCANLNEALKCYLKAAEKGLIEAEYELGLTYEESDKLEKNGEEAVKWYLKAAEKGHLEAPFRLGEMYKHGRGVAKDYKQAVKWYLIAAEKGDAKAQYRLGTMYKLGYGVQKNDSASDEWYRRASEQGVRHLADLPEATRPRTALSTDPRGRWIVIKDSHGRCSVRTASALTGTTIAGPFATKGEAHKAKMEMCPPTASQK